ncbi:MAG: MFS transporter [Williamsia sp.]|nr:MFS transporter [Williamsia sp.]
MSDINTTTSQPLSTSVKEVPFTLSKRLVLLMAVACGVSVANIYYNQPILKDIAVSFQVEESRAGLVSMLTQVGYGLGLFFLVPLGDKLSRKKLLLILLSLLCVALLCLAVSTSLLQVYALSVAIGILSISAQILLPMAATLDPVTTGKTVGVIYSGLLVGVLGARIFSGMISAWLGWRCVYAISAGLVLIVLFLLKQFLPSVDNKFEGHYFQLLRSTLIQVKRFPVLREAALSGGLIFGMFCSFWTTFTFHLSGAPFYFHTDTIGLFGFLAITGALCAPLFGRLADAGNSRRSLIYAVLTLLVSILIAKVFPHSILSMIICVLLLDVGVQLAQVTNVSRIYGLDRNSHSRINTIYMTTYFVGGALGTSVGLLCWKYGGWSFVTWQMMLWTGLALLVLVKAEP